MEKPDLKKRFVGAERVRACGVRVFVVGSSAQLADSARFVKRMSSAVELAGCEQVRAAPDDDLDDPAAAAGAKPLFLGSVVGRRFPYRWIVMALSGFVCMAIIATLSVVYSNTW